MKRNKWVVATGMMMLVFALILSGCGGGDQTAVNSTDDAQPKTSETVQATAGAAASGDEDGDKVVVELKNFAFQPAEITVAAGTTVVFRNEDVSTHNVLQTTEDKVNSEEPGFESPQLPQGVTWEYTFNEPGEYPVLCTVGSHYLMGMVGNVIVTP